VENSIWEKPLRGSQTQDIHYSEDNTSYKWASGLIKHRRRPDGSQGSSGWTTMQSISREIYWNSFLFLSHVQTVIPCRPDGRTFATSNFHIKASRVRTMLTGVRTSGLWMRYLPYGWARPDGNPRRSDGCSDLPITMFWKEILKLVEYWVSSGCVAETSGRMQVGVVRNFSTQWKVRTGSSRHPDGCCLEQMDVRTVWHVVLTADREPNFLTCKLRKIFWKHF